MLLRYHEIWRRLSPGNRSGQLGTYSKYLGSTPVPQAPTKESDAILVIEASSYLPHVCRLLAQSLGMAERQGLRRKW